MKTLADQNERSFTRLCLEILPYMASPNIAIDLLVAIKRGRYRQIDKNNSKMFCYISELPGKHFCYSFCLHIQIFLPPWRVLTALLMSQW